MNIFIKLLALLSFNLLILNNGFGQTSIDYIKSGIENLGIGNYTEAIKNLNSTIEIDAQSADAYQLRAMAKFKLKDYRGAIIDDNAAILLDPKNADAYSIRGMAKYGLGDKEGGCIDLSKAGELGDSNVYKFIEKYCN
jgi:tetratricopeptide (TPR) repeat protein